MSLARPTFQVVRYREGYSAEQVDLAVETVLENLSLPRPRIDRSDIEALRFLPVRMRSSYEMSSVDDWFSDAADELDLRHRATPDERPSTGAAATPAPTSPTPAPTSPTPTTPGAIEEVGSGWVRTLVLAAVVVVLAVLVYVSFA